MSHGFQKASSWLGEGKKAVGVIGDSTFFHGGMTGLAGMVFNKSAGVVVVLDNRTTAMTGHQPHPGSGITAKGEPTEEIKIEDVARSMGVKMWPSWMLTIWKQRKNHPPRPGLRGAVSGGIPASLCPLKGLPKLPPLEVDQDKCTQCHSCLRIGCPALVHHPDKSVTVDVNSCTGCTVCAQVCPFDAIAEVGVKSVAKVTNVLLVGVGGQGTILAARILSGVLQEAGYDVKMSEVHGMSQRGGSVVTFVRYGDKVYSPLVDKGRPT